MYRVPDAKDPRYAIPATRSKPTTAIASAAPRLKRVLLRDYHSRGGVYSFSESRAFDEKASRRGGDWGHGSDGLVVAVDCLPRESLVVRLHENLAALIEGEFRLALEDQHDLHVAHVPALGAQALSRLRQVHPLRLLERRDEGGCGPARFEQVVRHRVDLGLDEIGTAGPSPFNFSAATPARQEAVRRSESTFASSARIWSSRAWVAGFGGSRRGRPPRTTPPRARRRATGCREARTRSAP